MMDTSKLQNKFYKVISERMKKETQLENLVQDWLNGNIELSNIKLEQIIESIQFEVESLKKEETKIWLIYQRSLLENQKIINAARSVKHNFNVSPDELIINGGTLSSKSNETHLIGRYKTIEELEEERNNLISAIKFKVLRKEISFSEASKFLAEINLVYGNNSSKENKKTI